MTLPDLLARIPNLRGKVSAGAAFVFLISVAAYNLTKVTGVVEAASLNLSAKNKAAQTKSSTQPDTKPSEITVDTATVIDEPKVTPNSECKLPATISVETPVWQSWTSLSGTRVEAQSAAPEIPVYAARIPNGAVALVANHAEEKSNFRLSVKLGRGVYTVDRLVMDQKMPETSGRVERLESVVLGGKGTLTKPGYLESGSFAIYRFTNRSAEVQNAYDSVKDAVRAMMKAHPGECRNLMNPLHECEGHLGSLSKGIQPGKRYDSLRFIHRALLTVSHAQALCQNYRGQARLPRTEADQLDSALDRLQTSLTELSAGCLNLMPSISIAPVDPAKPSSREVTVQLANAGQQSVSMVRLGAEGPAGASVAPSDSAIFDVLKPGETARATFTVRAQADMAAQTQDLSADIAWFASRSPAHMKLKSPL